MLYYIVGDNMKEKIKTKFKKVVFPIFISVLSGSVCGHLVFSIYEDKTELAFDTNYLIQSWEYSTYDNMLANTFGVNYVYYEDEGLYKAIIGITKDESNVEKIKKAYGKETVVSKYLLNDLELCGEISKLDKLLNSTDDDIEIQQIVVKMLELYKQGKNVELSKVEKTN